MSNNVILLNTMNVLQKYGVEALSIESSESKLSIMFKENISNQLLETLHKELIK